jgi:hypothetical protein
VKTENLPGENQPFQSFLAPEFRPIKQFLTWNSGKEKLPKM